MQKFITTWLSSHPFSGALEGRHYMLQKLAQLHLIDPILAANLEDIEPVVIDLADRHGPLHMAIYRIRPGAGILFWVGRSPAGARSNGALIFLDSAGNARLRFTTVDHLYGWPQAECSKNQIEFMEKFYEQEKAKGELSGDELHDAWNAVYCAAQAAHHNPVADAVAEACKRLDITTLCKWDGYFVWGEIPGVTLFSDANWGQGSQSGQYMTQFGTYRWAPREPEPVFHFVAPVKDGSG